MITMSLFDTDIDNDCDDCISGLHIIHLMMDLIMMKMAYVM